MGCDTPMEGVRSIIFIFLFCFFHSYFAIDVKGLSFLFRVGLYTAPTHAWRANSGLLLKHFFLIIHFLVG